MIRPLAGAVERINALNATIRRHSLFGPSNITAKSVIEYDQSCPPFYYYQTTSEPTLQLPGLDLLDTSEEGEDELIEDIYSSDEDSSLVDEYSDAYDYMASPSPLHETLVDVGTTEEAHTGDQPEDLELEDSVVDPHAGNDASDAPEVEEDLERSYSHQEDNSAAQRDEYESEMVSETPPSMLVEPEVPDPFIVDDSKDDSDSDSNSNGEGAGAGDEDSISGEDGGTPAAADEIALAQSIIIEPPQQPVGEPSTVPDASHEPPSTSLLDVNKTVPPTPPTPQTISDDDEEEEPPELYLPGLILPTMFLPIPNVRFYCLSCRGCLACVLRAVYVDRSVNEPFDKIHST